MIKNILFYNNISMSKYDVINELMVYAINWADWTTVVLSDVPNYVKMEELVKSFENTEDYDWDLYSFKEYVESEWYFMNIPVYDIEIDL